MGSRFYGKDMANPYGLHTLPEQLGKVTGLMGNYWQLDIKGRTAAQQGFEPDSTTHLLNSLFCDSKAEPRT